MDPSSLPPPPPSPPGEIPALPTTPEPAKKRGGMVVAVSVLVAVVATTMAVGTWISAPGRCDDASFTSSRYAYCLETPTGAVSSEVDDDSGQYDRFQLASGASVSITAVRLRGESGLQEYVDGFVAAAAEQSFTAAEPVSVRVAGAQGVQVDLTGDANGTPVHFRFVFVQRERVVWQVNLQAVEDQFETHTKDLDLMLDSWTFT